MKMPVQFVFSDGRSRTLQVDPGASLLAASKEDGLALLVDCEEGICGTCQARLCGGSVNMDEYSPGVLSESEVKDGMVLVCRSRADGAAIIELPYSSSDALLQQDEEPCEAIVSAVERVATDTVSLSLTTREPLHYLPGQYVNISPESGVERSFSMASAPGTTKLQFAIAQRADGQFSGWLGRARAGARVQLSPARGTFYLRVDKRPKVMVAGGTGLAPFMAMLETLAVGRDAERSASIQLLVGARSDSHLFGLEAVERMRARLPNLQIRVACDEVAEGSNVRKGRVTELLAEIDIDPAATIYACGPPPMVEAARHAVKARKLPLKQFLAEKFTG